MRAPQADNFKIAGPLIPQWVINKGPVDSSLLPITLTLTWVAIPGNSLIRGSLILKVNREGTGVTIAWPKVCNISQIFGLLPVAKINFSAR